MTLGHPASSINSVCHYWRSSVSGIISNLVGEKQGHRRGDEKHQDNLTSCCSTRLWLRFRQVWHRHTRSHNSRPPTQPHQDSTRCCTLTQADTAPASLKREPLPGQWCMAESCLSWATLGGHAVIQEFFSSVDLSYPSFVLIFQFQSAASTSRSTLW